MHRITLSDVMMNASAGKPPFTSKSPIQIILKHVREEPISIAAATKSQTVPPDLDYIMMRCSERIANIAIKTPAAPGRSASLSTRQACRSEWRCKSIRAEPARSIRSRYFRVGATEIGEIMRGRCRRHYLLHPESSGWAGQAAQLNQRLSTRHCRHARQQRIRQTLRFYALTPSNTSDNRSCIKQNMLACKRRRC